LDVPDDGHYLVDFGRPKPGHDLVQKEQSGFGGQGPGDFEPFVIGDGQVAGFGLLFVGEIERVQHRQGLFPGLVGFIRGGGCTHHDIVEHAFCGKRFDNLERPGQSLPDRFSRLLCKTRKGPPADDTATGHFLDLAVVNF
jgi:hypothetical protein